MKNIKEIPESLVCVQEMEYSFKILFCGKEDCGMCTSFGRRVRTPHGVNSKSKGRNIALSGITCLKSHW